MDYRETIIEACAKVCEGRIGGAVQSNEWWAGFKAATKQCAAAIRALDKDKIAPRPEPVERETIREACAQALSRLILVPNEGDRTIDVEATNQAIAKCIEVIHSLDLDKIAPRPQPVGDVTISHHRGMENREFDYYGSLPDGTYQLYAEPVAAPAVPPELAERCRKVLYGNDCELAPRPEPVKLRFPAGSGWSSTEVQAWLDAHGPLYVEPVAAPAVPPELAEAAQELLDEFENEGNPKEGAMIWYGTMGAAITIAALRICAGRKP
jgi:hypothetical protein